MLLTSLPFDYAKLLDTTDRVRVSRKRPTGMRVRRGAATRDRSE
jgi:hypothetical protein